MLHIAAFVFNAFQENTYIIYNDKKQCWIVDPGMYDEREKSALTKYINDNQLTPQAIINTHGHIDHIFGIKASKDKYNIPFLIHEKEQHILNNAVGSAMLFGFEMNENPVPDAFIKQGTVLALGDEHVDVRFTPGHSPGSISFYYQPGNWVIAGDALFAGSIGRTDLPGGNHETLVNSIREQLFNLPEQTTVYSGHGPATTIGNEIKYNPFFQE
jgi:glyoxylase-like metal-dependent hydrolase (beta-lactamase superfamily II)